jgi:gamma-glutamyltranspeptidase / glutathione hydrolase
MTGIGGDMFCLYYDAKTKKMSALNGSGRAGKNYTLEATRKALSVPEGQAGTIDSSSIHSVTVPGAAAGWVDTVERFGSGKLSMEQILAPAIKMGEEGFPVSEITAHFVSFPDICQMSKARLTR